MTEFASREHLLVHKLPKHQRTNPGYYGFGLLQAQMPSLEQPDPE